MKKLMNIIDKMNQDQYSKLKAELIATDSRKMLILFNSYRDKNYDDNQIKAEIGCTDNAFLVLKSRLFDRIQKGILSESDLNLEEVKYDEKKLQELIINNRPEYSEAILVQLEKRLLQSNSVFELLHIYRLLKRVHQFSDKQYHFSQLYNNQIAQFISLERAIDIYYDFNKTMASYLFTYSETEKELLFVLKKELQNILHINKSVEVELLYGLATIQLKIFCNSTDDEKSIFDLFSRCNEILNSSSSFERREFYKPALLLFEFIHSMNYGETKRGIVYYEKLICT